MLTLVGFDLHAEFRILAHQYPHVLGCFNSWVDIQEFAREITTLPHAPSLQNTLIAFGYESNYPTTTSRNDGHNAGNDALRSISVLVSLLFFPPQGEALAQTCMDYHSSRAKQREHSQRFKIDMKKSDLFSKGYPFPREKYPFRAKVDLPGAFFPRLPDAGILCEYFLRFKPVAAGSNKTQVFGGWICLDSLEELERFVEQVHGLEDAEGRRTWIATSQYDPKVVLRPQRLSWITFWSRKQSPRLLRRNESDRSGKETSRITGLMMGLAEAVDGASRNKSQFRGDWYLYAVISWGCVLILPCCFGILTE